MCYRPVHLRQRGVVVPCNKCPKCVGRRTSAWSFRLLQEDLVSSSSHFITLTYDTRHVPLLEGGFLTLCKRDVQLFFKRLRKLHSGSERSGIRYYVVGEYGGRTERPHYHALVFNAKLECYEDAWKTVEVPYSRGYPQRIGDIHYGTVTGASVGYCLKYMCKPKRFAPGVRSDDPRQREFAVMSKGLGVSYIEKMAWYHAEDLVNRMYCTMPGGVKVSMPRYYKDKLYWDEERKAIADAYAIINSDRIVKKLMAQSARDVWNEQQAIDAAYDKMYRSSSKCLL